MRNPVGLHGAAVVLAGAVFDLKAVQPVLGVFEKNRHAASGFASTIRERQPVLFRCERSQLGQLNHLRT